MAASDLDVLILTNQRVAELTKEEALYCAQSVSDATEQIAQTYLEETEAKQIKDMKDLLHRAFIYCFDKGVETCYNLRAKVDNDIEYNYPDLLQGMGGDKIPEYIQLKITPLISKVGILFASSLNFISNNEASYLEAGISLHEQTKALLMGASQLGVEYMLRLDLNDQSEMEAYLN
jgi:hypothetical protein